MRPHGSVKNADNRESIVMAGLSGDITTITTTDGIEATADKDSFRDQRVQIFKNHWTLRIYYEDGPE